MATDFKDLEKNLSKVFETMNKGLNAIEIDALEDGIAAFKLRTFSNRSKDVNNQPLGFYKSNYYAVEVKNKFPGSPVSLQLTDQLRKSIQIGKDAKKQNAIGFLSNLVNRHDARSDGGKTIKANGLENPELADFINKEYGDTIAFSEREAKIVQDQYDKEFLKLFNKAMDRVF